MANVEFIQKRIEGKEKEIEKLNKKFERILKAEASNWEKNPYWYSERDLVITQKDIKAAQATLDGYRAQLEAEIEKANSRNIPAILEFLAQWKERTMKYYKEDAFPQYLKERDEWYAFDKAYVNWSNTEGYNMRKNNREEYNRITKEHDEKRAAFRSKWAFIVDLVDYNIVPFEGKKYFFNEEKFQKILDQEANAKYDFIIERTNIIVGQITDASGLSVGAKGELNGIIIGTKGKAKVETIGAGGWNIQIFHWRTLINPVK